MGLPPLFCVCRYCSGIDPLPVREKRKPSSKQIFNTAVRQPYVMNLKTIIILILVVALPAAFSGCTATTGPTPQSAVLTPEPVTPVKTTIPITPLPAGEIARIKVGHFGMDKDTATIYEFLGDVQVNNGPYHAVQVILLYPDGQEYASDIGGMGGANATIKPFYLYPDNRYKGTNPEKIIVLDGKKYGTAYRNENTVDFWIATADNPLNT